MNETNKHRKLNQNKNHTIIGMALVCSYDNYKNSISRREGMGPSPWDYGWTVCVCEINF